MKSSALGQTLPEHDLLIVVADNLLKGGFDDRVRSGVEDEAIHRFAALENKPCPFRRNRSLVADVVILIAVPRRQAFHLESIRQSPRTFVLYLVGVIEINRIFAFF